MTALDPGRFERLWQAIGAANAPAEAFNELCALYSEPHRHYHNPQHIAECLAEFEATRQLAREPLVVELAIWFHDAIYDPRAADNEARSAALARQRLAEAKVPEPAVEAAVSLILATQTHEPVAHPDAGLMLDIDLSILGKPAERFDAYETAIRQEFAWVPEDIFRARRAEILDRFLGRTRLYVTDTFHQTYEASARQNLAGSLRKLRSGPDRTQSL